MDQFISLRLIYSSISDKEVLDKKNTFWDNLYRRIRGWYLALPLEPWEGPRANQMDQFISLRLIYSSISDKEVLDNKRHFFGTTCIGASAVGIWPFHLDPGEALGQIRWTSLYLCVRFTAKFPTRWFWIK